MNTTFHVMVESDGFRAAAELDVDITSFAAFAAELKQLYDTLQGTAILQESFGDQNFIRFTAQPTGHIAVRGSIDSCGRNGFMQKLTFENDFEQSYLRDFSRQLYLTYVKDLSSL